MTILTTPLDDLRHQAGSRPEGVAVSLGGTGSTYRELLEGADRLARGLVAHGVQPGDRVTLHMANSVELVASYYACFLVGAIACPVTTRATSAELERVLRRLRPTVHLAQAHLDQVAAGVGEQALSGTARFVTGTPEAGSAAQPWQALTRHGAARLPRSDASDAGAPAVLLSTSGTTGEAKFVVHTGRSLSATVDALVQSIVEQERLALGASVVNASGLMSWLACVRRGVPMLMVAQATPDAVLDAVEADGVSRVGGMPDLFAGMVRQQRERPRDVRTLRFCLSGGDACPPGLQEEFLEVFGVPLRQFWSASEVMGALTYGLGPGPVSRVLPGTEVRIVDEAGQDVARGDTGELLLRRDNVSIGYWTGPGEITGGPHDGWISTRDLFRQGDGDDLWFVARTRDLIVRGGLKISPVEVESALERHPRVAEAGVVGVPDDVLGQRVAAVLRITGDPGAVDLADVAATAAGGLAEHKRPERLVVVDAVPRTALGKVDRAALLAMVAPTAASLTEGG